MWKEQSNIVFRPLMIVMQKKQLSSWSWVYWLIWECTSNWWNWVAAQEIWYGIKTYCHTTSPSWWFKLWFQETKVESEWHRWWNHVSNPASFNSEMNTDSSFPVMPAIYGDLFTQPPATQSQPNPQTPLAMASPVHTTPFFSHPSCFPRDFTFLELCFPKSFSFK